MDQQHVTSKFAPMSNFVDTPAASQRSPHLSVTGTCVDVCTDFTFTFATLEHLGNENIGVYART